MSSPITPEAPIPVTVTGAGAGESVRLYGSWIVGPGPCNSGGTVCLDLQSPVRSFGTATADASGAATLEFTLPATAVGAGDTFALQALVIRGAGGADSILSDAFVVEVEAEPWSELADDFESGTTDPAVWESVVGDAAVTSAHARGAYSLNLGGGGGTATTWTTSTASCTEVVWSYWRKRGPESPDARDSLTLEYDDGAGFVLADTWYGGEGTDDDFTLRWGVISDPGAFHAAFRIRLVSAGTGSLNDDFYVDDLFVGCGGGDADLDGVPAMLDCADEDAAVHPGAAEIVADGLDQDCDGFDTCYQDTDADGYGTELTVIDNDLDCTNGSTAAAALTGDCNDGDGTVHPGALEIADDGLDNDCDGVVDTPLLTDDFESGATDPAVWEAVVGDAGIASSYAVGTYSLVLGGGGGTATTWTTSTTACSEVVWSYRGKRGPDAPDASDFLALQYDDGSGFFVLEDTWYGTGASDSDFALRWGIISDSSAFHETFRVRLVSVGSGSEYDDFFVDDLLVGCSGGDSDLDGVPAVLDCDDADASAGAAPPWYEDADADGFGTGLAQWSCTAPLGWVPDATDCDDADRCRARSI